MPAQRPIWSRNPDGTWTRWESKPGALMTSPGFVGGPRPFFGGYSGMSSGDQMALHARLRNADSHEGSRALAGVKALTATEDFNIGELVIVTASFRKGKSGTIIKVNHQSQWPYTVNYADGSGDEPFAFNHLRKAAKNKSRSRSRSSISVSSHSSSSSSSAKKQKKKKQTQKKGKRSKKKRRVSSSSSSSSSGVSICEPAAAAIVENAGSADKPVVESPAVLEGKAKALEQLLKLKNMEPQDARLKEYRKLLREWHPDKNPDRKEVATAVFQFLQKGKSVLKPA